jgi:hypothetical protein
MRRSWLWRWGIWGRGLCGCVMFELPAEAAAAGIFGSCMYTSAPGRVAFPPGTMVGLRMLDGHIACISIHHPPLKPQQCPLFFRWTVDTWMAGG